MKPVHWTGSESRHSCPRPPAAAPTDKPLRVLLHKPRPRARGFWSAPSAALSPHSVPRLFPPLSFLSSSDVIESPSAPGLGRTWEGWEPRPRPGELPACQEGWARAGQGEPVGQDMGCTGAALPEARERCLALRICRRSRLQDSRVDIVINTTYKWVCFCVSEAECLPSTREALGSIPSTAKKQKQEGKNDAYKWIISTRKGAQRHQPPGKC